MSIIDKLSSFIDYFNKTFGTSNDKIVVSYKYITEKTLNVIIKGLTATTLKKIVKDKFELSITNFFGVVPNYKIGSSLSITLVDIGKINYNLFVQFIKSTPVDSVSDCDNYFCTFQEYTSVCLNNTKFKNSELYVEIFNRVRRIDFDNYKKSEVISSACALLYKNFPSLNWVNSQISYLNSLDTLSKQIVTLYSITGDRLINFYMRNGNTINDGIFKLFQANYNDNVAIYKQLMKIDYYDVNTVNVYIRRLIRKLKAIIDNSPLIDTSFYVYRGRTDKITVPKSYALDSFISTSLLTRVAVDFSRDKTTGNYGTIIRFKLRGRALLLSNSKYLKEYEILLPFGYRYTLKSQQNGEFINSIGQKITATYVEYS